MGSSSARRLRLLLAAMAWLAAGAVAASAASSTRAWTVAAVLALIGAALAWPLAKPAAAAPPVPEPPPAPDARKLAMLQAQLDHLPVAAWLRSGPALQALSSRAHRLLAPGGVRDAAALRERLASAERSGALVLDTERGSERWQLRLQPLALDGQAQALLVLVPLESELESASLQAWQQLVQVLTHEIMNSLTPIQSLSQTAIALLDEPGAQADLQRALDAIQRRAGSLQTFIVNYRQVSQWPAPQMTPVDLGALFSRLQLAVAPQWQARGGAASFELASPGLRLLADDGQLEQALLALLRNAEQATAGQPEPRLWVQARPTRGGRLQISVRDNGTGVPPGLERQIFLPFFSAREASPDIGPDSGQVGGQANGQGIGLSVVRQLVHGMGGRVRHVRPLERGATFVLSF